MELLEVCLLLVGSLLLDSHHHLLDTYLPLLDTLLLPLPVDSPTVPTQPLPCRDTPLQDSLECLLQDTQPLACPHPLCLATRPQGWPSLAIQAHIPLLDSPLGTRLQGFLGCQHMGLPQDIWDDILMEVVILGLEGIMGMTRSSRRDRKSLDICSLEG